MAIIKSKDIEKMSDKDINEKIKELKLELIRNQVNANKGGKLKTREIKRTIARIHTFNRLKKPVEKK
jgi:ribosomal protein L29